MLRHLTGPVQYNLTPRIETHNPAHLETGTVARFTRKGGLWIKLESGKWQSENGHVCRKSKRCEYVGYQLSLKGFGG